MVTVSLEEASAKLARLIKDVQAGAEVCITENQQPVAKLVGVPRPVAGKRQLGLWRGLIHMADDLDAPLDDFEEYMR